MEGTWGYLAIVPDGVGDYGIDCEGALIDHCSARY